MVPMCTALVLGSALLSVHLVSGSALPVQYSNQSYPGLNADASLLAPRMDHAGTMATGVSDPLDVGIITHFQSNGRRLLRKM